MKKNSMRNAVRFDAHRSVTRHQLSDLRDYAQTIEELIETERDRLSRNEPEDLTEDNFEDVMISQAEDYLLLRDSFPIILRNSLFITIYTVLEDELMKTCNRLRESFNVDLKPSDLKGKGINRSRKYLKKVVVINFPDNTNEWKEIRKFNLLRNTIAHSNGNIIAGETDQEKLNNKELCAYIEKSSIIDISSNFHIQLSKDFILHALDITEAFLIELFQNIAEELKKLAFELEKEKN